MKLRYKIAYGFLGGLALLLVVAALTLSYTAPCAPPGGAGDEDDSVRAWVHRCYGSPDVLELSRVRKPEPGEHEVLVRVRAASLNPLDRHYLYGSPYLMRLGTGIGSPDDMRVGVDFAGVVEAVGSEVTQFVPGDRVYGGASGAFADYVVMGETGALVRLPEGVAFEDAASLPIAAISALQALRDAGNVQPGDKVLVNGASGGVGTFAVQIAKSLGAEVHGVCSTRNVELVRALGADRVFDYRKESYIDSGQTYDVIVDLVGNYSAYANRKVLQPGGTLVLVGGPKGDWIAPFKRPLGAMLLSPFVDERFEVFLATLNKEDLATLAGMVRDGTLSPVIGQRFSLSAVPDAFRFYEERGTHGKIVIVMP